MASKIKVDQIQTADGSGTIALQNQLSGMTTASLPALGSAQMPTGSVLQVVSTTKTDTLALTASSYTDVTGVSATITPSSTSSKIYVVITTGYSISSTGYGGALQVVRGSTAIGGGTASGNKPSSFSTQTFDNTEHFETASYNYLDSPNTTSATTYKLQALVRSGVTMYFGRTASDRDDSFMGRTSSTITLMEIAG